MGISSTESMKKVFGTLLVNIVFLTGVIMASNDKEKFLSEISYFSVVSFIALLVIIIETIRVCLHLKESIERPFLSEAKKEFIKKGFGIATCLIIICLIDIFFNKSNLDFNFFTYVLNAILTFIKLHIQMSYILYIGGVIKYN